MSWSGSVASSGSGSRRRPRPLERMLFARTHKAALEEALVRRRETERVRGEFWSGAVNYFDKMERANGRFASWTSDQSYKARYVCTVLPINKTNGFDQFHDVLGLSWDHLRIVHVSEMTLYQWALS